MRSVLQNSGIEGTVNHCSYEVNYNSYEQQAPITLPDGAKEKAAAWAHLLEGNPDNGDGTYTIREGMSLVDIPVPEGFTVANTAYDTLELEQDDNNRKITYMMYYLEDGEDDAGTYFTQP